MTLRFCMAGIVALAAGAAAAAAPAGKSCMAFDLFSVGAGKPTQYIDLDASGANSAGDKMIAHRRLADAKGEEIGDRYFIGVIHAVDAAGKEISRTTEVIVVLKAGVIFATKERVDGKDLPSKIIGGTGAFADATGVEKVSRQGEANIYHYRVNCGESS